MRPLNLLELLFSCGILVTVHYKIKKLTMKNSKIQISHWATIPTKSELQKEKVDIAIMLWRLTEKRDIDIYGLYGSRIFMATSESLIFKKIKTVIKELGYIVYKDQHNQDLLSYVSSRYMPVEILTKLAKQLSKENVTINYD